MNRRELAENYFYEGYNCAQAIVLAYKDYFDIEEKELLKLASPFGGGMSRLRETCGAISGILFVLGSIEGDFNNDLETKTQLYKDVQKLALEFEDKNKSIICRELMDLNVKHDDPTPHKRDANYYLTRPCKRLIGDASEILQNYLNKRSK